ncbi:nitrogen fixation/metabolism regulation signal transduction histidine kinase [Inhella inkyongensis]|uniref:histidine kinase n=1 Tax=Inhella inkyongensis TaxID=392593 RepID=A0A840S0A9_9BURK|nr:ATP-binding protein [Inhella inkyongensis]MBB5202808.1 nitrogen fixation/metabolism regulation signal transduction histidine kinase [Inhella inkyongensis]
MNESDRSRLRRWAWTLSLLAVAAASGVLAYLLSIGATTPSGFFERHQAWLYWVNMGVGGLLGLVALGAALRLALRVRSGRFGAHLLSRLAIVFAVVAVGPGALIYAVSYSFVNRSIESLFDVRLASALEAGLNLGRATLDAQTETLAEQARQGAQRLTEGGVQALALERLRAQWGAERVAVISSQGTVLEEVLDSAAPAPSATLARERIDAALLRRAARDGSAAQLRGLEDEGAALAGQAHVRALALLPSTALSLTDKERYLMVQRALPISLVRNALAVQAANLEYQRRGLERDGLRRMYLGTLTLVLVLAVFVALLLAIQLGNHLAKPLLLLADGMRKVAAGDLTRKPTLGSRDELGGLTRAFADMTDQLGSARDEVQRSVAAVDAARDELQTILDNLTSGVIVFDRERRLLRRNPSASLILKHELPLQQALPAELQGFAEGLWQRFQGLVEDEPGVGEHWQHTVELSLEPLAPPATLLLRGAVLPRGDWLLVFDDISEVVSAQRSAAWGEVARRLAHEIKNPLTPIQLSAERLEHKLAAKLEQDSDRAMLTRSVATIVNQVQAMKQLVNEFRDYARLPAAQLAPLDLNGLVSEVTGLYPDAAESLRLVIELESRLPWVLGDATQLRQVIHNLVQNGLDAVSDRPDGRVVVSTKQLHADDGSVRAVRLSLVDNGPGFAEQVLTRAFEPYVTTKSKGTGLGLAVVKKIADEHGARIRLSNLLPSSPDSRSPQGAVVSLTFTNLAAAPAGAAQSA